jgi:hypothetical protein
MWVRVTCPNGHRVKIETKYLGRENRCPRCQSHVYLWIRVTCPNGHVLRVQSKYAGRMGSCPDCKERVMVPDLTEIIAMETLGDSVLSSGDEKNPTQVHVGPSSGNGAQAGSALGSASSTSGVAMDDSTVAKQPREPMRDCPGCKARIPKNYRTCPHCNKFLGDAEVTALKSSTSGGSVKCAECGVTSFPGDEYCSSCGAPL